MSSMRDKAHEIIEDNIQEAIIKDHGVREEMDTGSVRDTQLGKPRPDLIPPSSILKLAMHYGAGAGKYDD